MAHKIQIPDYILAGIEKDEEEMARVEAIREGVGPVSGAIYDTGDEWEREREKTAHLEDRQRYDDEGKVF